MAYVGNESNIMRPSKGDSSIFLPVTFDYSGGRRDSNRKKIIYSVSIMAVGIIVGFGVMFRDGNRFVQILLGLLEIYGVFLGIRYVLLKESTIRKQYKELDSCDYKKDFREVWGIYSIDEDYPYFVRYRNGKTGLFVGLNKDVVLGKYSESEYEHYEAIGDAYNVAGASNIGMCHIDFMDNVGSDERLEQSFIGLEEVENPDIKNVLMDTFGYLQQQMNSKVTSSDVYVFTFWGSEVTAWNTIQRILSCFLDANFVSYHIFDSEDIRELFRSLYNLHDFSVNNAMLNSFASSVYGVGIVPIKIVHSDGGEEKLNMTAEERVAEMKAKEEEALIKKKLKKKRKKKSENDDEEIDLF